MADYVQICPHCGNYVQGTKSKTYKNKVVRQGAKTAVHSATSVGGMGLGAEIGSAFGPIGTVVGGALGFVGSAMFNQKVNSEIDDFIDIFTDIEYHCPKCGYSWQGESIHEDTTTDDSEFALSIEERRFNNTEGLFFHARITLHGYKDKQCRIVVLFQDKAGNYLHDTNGVCSNDDGDVLFCEEFTPPYEDTVYEDYQLFAPYSEMHHSEGGKLDLLFAIIDDDNDILFSDVREFDCPNIKYISTDHILSAWRGNEKGIEIHTRFTAIDMKDVNGAVVIYFLFSAMGHPF